MPDRKRIYSEVADAVARRWRQVEYNGCAKRKKFDESSPNPSIESNNLDSNLQVIDLTSDSDDKEEMLPDETLGGEKYSFKLIKSEYYDLNLPENIRSSSDFISLKDIFGNSNLESTVLFSYQFNLDFLLDQFHPSIKSITMVAQKGTINPVSPESFHLFPILDKCKIIDIYMPPYTSHHSKMILNFYRDKSVKIFIPSNNFTHHETNLPQQICWCSPSLYQGKTGSVLFQENLLSYLKSYEDKTLNTTIYYELLQLNFESLKDVDFVYSCPSKENASSGLKLLVELLSKHDNDKSGHYLCQTSTIGGPLNKSQNSNIFTHLMIPALSNMFGMSNSSRLTIPTTEQVLQFNKNNNIKPYILYPTVKELQNCPMGWLPSGWFHFNYDRIPMYYETLKEKFDIFYKQDAESISIQRRATPSHSKFYMKSSTETFTELDWCLYTSANLSMSAWGKITTKPRNYEVGVLFTGKDRLIRCTSFIDLIYKRTDGQSDVVVPFTLKLQKYEADDEAFCMSKDYGLLDINGRLYER
ncbi:hypothetical protein KAFR_0G02220 [Kazachstania africana CBS 2517]|uniref:PLD phosphodiesterase domain-containing protein n=1 Tax=Kazachstania africana (strain ATCC 22294 / BCRC 22015 / CBS 2517 / CECT 1963 / NBRC 1671 / NRRL Y-8276) TaxID=1071382 RepID=H2AY06_KAZAF|nr:hypothetical protein KAFR_0G02220 [Kazachstania africana CBS 2517]CCF59256.1 hypothetical protein KAFR_0G02220 [Kazachstania africana CBS 2517]